MGRSTFWVVASDATLAEMVLMPRRRTIHNLIDPSFLLIPFEQKQACGIERSDADPGSLSESTVVGESRRYLAEYSANEVPISDLGSKPR